MGEHRRRAIDAVSSRAARAAIARVLAAAVLALQLLLVLGLATSPTSALAAGDEVPDELIVGLTAAGQQQAADVHRKRDVASATPLRQPSVARVKVAPGTAAQAAAAYAADPRVRYVELNRKVRIAGQPNDPSFAQQWGLSKIGAP